MAPLEKKKREYSYVAQLGTSSNKRPRRQLPVSAFSPGSNKPTNETNRNSAQKKGKVCTTVHQMRRSKRNEQQAQSKSQAVNCSGEDTNQSTSAEGKDEENKCDESFRTVVVDLTYDDDTEIVFQENSSVASTTNIKNHKQGSVIQTAVGHADYRLAFQLQTDYNMLNDEAESAQSASDHALAYQIQQDLLQSWEVENENNMLSSDSGKALVFVSRAIQLHKTIQEEVARAKHTAFSVPPSYDERMLMSQISTVATDDLVWLTEQMLKKHKSLINMRDGSLLNGARTVDIGYHYTRHSNLSRIRTDGLLTKAERSERSIASNNNGSTYGDGIYTGNDPLRYTKFGDTGLIVARIRGITTMDPSDIGTAHSFVNDKRSMTVLRCSSLCVPIIQYPTLLVMSNNATSNGSFGKLVIDMYHRRLQELIDDMFNGATRKKSIRTSNRIIRNPVSPPPAASTQLKTHAEPARAIQTSSHQIGGLSTGKGSLDGRMGHDGSNFVSGRGKSMAPTFISLDIDDRKKASSSSEHASSQVLPKLLCTHSLKDRNESVDLKVIPSLFGDYGKRKTRERNDCRPLQSSSTTALESSTTFGRRPVAASAHSPLTMQSVQESLSYTAPQSLNSPTFNFQSQLEDVTDDPRAGECAICLSDLFGVESTNERVVSLKVCRHVFHHACILRALDHGVGNRCPCCLRQILEPRGLMPSGTMDVMIHQSRSDVIKISYSIPKGIQKQYHENPGQRHGRVNRRAFIPNTVEGQKLLKRLKYAFMRGLTFRVGTSLTSGLPNQVTWSSIHHKTSLKPGGLHSLPDPSYAVVCNKELDSLGVPDARHL